MHQEEEEVEELQLIQHLMRLLLWSHHRSKPLPRDHCLILNYYLTFAVLEKMWGFQSELPEGDGGMA